MKSSFNPSRLRQDARVETWQPDAIFPSLIPEDTGSMVDDILNLFQPAGLPGDGRNSDIGDGIPERKIPVRTWEWKDLSAASPVEPSLHPAQKQISGLLVHLGTDEKQRLFSEARRQAEQTIQTARQNAADLIQKAQLEAEAIRREAYAQGRAQAEDELHKTVENAQIILDEMRAWRQKAVEHSDDLVIDMIKKIAHLLFDEGVVLSNVALQHNLNKVMKMAQAIGDLRIYMNPKDLVNLDPEWKRFQESLLGKKIQIIPADSIIPGGCYVQGEMGVVDAQVETQLAAVMEAFDPDPDKMEESPV